jgi:DNA-binding transcriptional MerR regulator
MFTIGEFSKITGLTVKTLRFYHEEQVLIPAFVDPDTGYRYYSDQQIHMARTIAFLRGMDFPVSELREILRRSQDTDQVLPAIEAHREAIQQKVKNLRAIVQSLDKFIAAEKEAQLMAQQEHDIVEKQLEPLLIAGIRMTGKYSDCGKAFSTIGRQLGRYVCGSPFLLHYDTEFRQDDADFEACMPVRQAKEVDGISMRSLPGGRCLALVHKGPYEQLGPAYARILRQIKQQRYEISMPTREVYLKGPGMILRGNPSKYLTEIQVLLA